MSPDNIILILVLATLVMFVYKGCGCKGGIDPSKTGKEIRENMYDVSSNNGAPLDFGTFADNYPRGECRTGKFEKRSDCEVGNCNLGTTVTDKQYCVIQCAQDPDPLEREECFNKCIDGL